MVKKCSKCGTTLTSSDIHCPECGNRVKKRKIIYLISILIFVIVIGSIVGVLMFGNDDRLHTVDVGVGTFNCSENLIFTLVDFNNDGFKEFRAGNDTYTVKVMDFNSAGYWYSVGYEKADEMIKNYPSFVVDNIRVYNTTANMGSHIGEVRYISILDNMDKNIQIQIITPNVEDTVQITKTFEFK